METHKIMKRYLFILMIVCLSCTAARAERLTITASMANIRSGPDTHSDILWKVEKYFPIEVIKKSDSWYYFQDFENDHGWVHQSLVGDVPAVITIRDLCNVRSGPSTKDEILFSVEKGIPFKVLERKDDWLHVEHADGDQGWIHDSLVW